LVQNRGGLFFGPKARGQGLGGEAHFRASRPDGPGSLGLKSKNGPDKKLKFYWPLGQGLIT
jgi:hypothetical protein